MTRRPNDTLSPFEETLTNLPTEAAPADLQDRCLAALDTAQVAPAKRRPVPWSYFGMAAAASLLIAVVALPLLLSHPKSGAPPVTLQLAEPGGAGPGASGAPSQWATARDGGPSGGPNGLNAGGPAGPAAPGPAARPERADNAATRAWALRKQQRDKIAQLQPAQPAPAAPPVDTPEPEQRSVVPPPAQPWYDRSPDRQKISKRDMTLEAPDVEETYQRVVAAIEKAGGYIEREDLSVQKRVPDYAHIAARVPVASFDAVVQQLRDLGKLVKLSGSSEDRTQEYKSRGVDIRALSATEQDLVRRYERERNDARKQALKWELDALRQRLHDEKQELQALAAETSFAYLDINITEGSGLWHSLKEKSAEALPIAMALALVALPFLVVLLVWRRRA